MEGIRCILQVSVAAAALTAWSVPVAAQVSGDVGTETQQDTGASAVSKVDGNIGTGDPLGFTGGLYGEPRTYGLAVTAKF